MEAIQGHAQRKVDRGVVNIGLDRLTTMQNSGTAGWKL